MEGGWLWTQERLPAHRPAACGAAHRDPAALVSSLRPSLRPTGACAPPLARASLRWSVVTGLTGRLRQVRHIPVFPRDTDGDADPAGGAERAVEAEEAGGQVGSTE